jgi:hypothetical protein
MRDALRARRHPMTSLTELLDQSNARSEHMLDMTLPYESRPDVARRVHFAGLHTGLVAVGNVIEDQDGHINVFSSSGFCISTPGTPRQTIVTCAHTLFEVHTPLF